jgi:hypothetical protein
MRATILGLSLLLAAGHGHAGGLADVSIYDRSSGQLLPTYSADGQQYVAGRPGNEYEIRIRNRTGEPILAVISVDGVNVVSGETAAPSQSGYVINGYRSLAIAGWRKSLERVAAFYFTDHGDAYATRTGRPDDVGVIGVAVFKRRPPEPPAPAALGFEQRSRGAAADAAPSAMRKAETENSLGTGHGRSENSQARYVDFQRLSDSPNEVIAIRYDTRANLVSRGVIQARRDPEPFPGRFVPDPPVR